MLGQIRQISALLKSDHFGIEIMMDLWGTDFLTILKSDHFGIEIESVALSPRPVITLKSDHFGIEIFQEGN